MKLLFITTTLAVIILTSGCIKHDKKLSAGVTYKPNSNYKITTKDSTDYEPTHNTRVANPYHELIPQLTSQVPVQFRPHSRLFLTDIEDRPFFDYFAWQTFIGLIWPADPNYRGLADPKVETAEQFLSTNIRNRQGLSVPVVWETFQTIQTALPNPSNTEPAQPQPWNAEKYTRPYSFEQMSKAKHLAALNEAFSSPLIDQNRQYVRYQLQLNEVMYEFIRQNKWYLKKNLPKSPTQASLPPLALDEDGKVLSLVQPQTNSTVKQPVNGNSITIKSAWRVMIEEQDISNATNKWRKKDDLSRYFVTTSDITDAVTNQPIEGQKMGLVGLHIVVKTPQFKQGIWASFEHVDNIKAPEGIRPSFNNGNGKFHPQGFSHKPNSLLSHAPKIEKHRDPVEVSRIYKIPDTPVATSEAFPYGLSTQGINQRYQELLKGTVWENYQLVITQWPTDPGSFYAKPFFYPRGFPFMEKPTEKQPRAVKQVYQRALNNAKAAYPRWSGLPIPQVGALNTVMETYFQNPNKDHNLEDTSCMGCHYGASDMDYSWALKLRTWPQSSKSGQGFEQGRINPEDTRRAKHPANIR